MSVSLSSILVFLPEHAGSVEALRRSSEQNVSRSYKCQRPLDRKPDQNGGRSQAVQDRSRSTLYSPHHASWTVLSSVSCVNHSFFFFNTFMGAGGGVQFVDVFTSSSREKEMNPSSVPSARLQPLTQSVWSDSHWKCFHRAELCRRQLSS